MDGFQATQMIRLYEAEQGRPSTPIIAMTAFTMPEDQQKCLASGMTDYISKPFTQEKLRDIILKNIRVPRFSHHVRQASMSPALGDSRI